MDNSLKAPLRGWPARSRPENSEFYKRICHAEWMLENALQERVPEVYPENIPEARLLHRSLLFLNKFYRAAIVGLVVLTLVEVPPWCHGTADHDMWTWKSGSEWCRVPGESKSETIYISNIWYLPPGYAVIAELIIEAVILYKWSKELALEDTHFHPVGVTWNSRTCIHLGRFFAVGSIADTLVFSIYRNPFRLTWLFRSGLLFLMPSVQRIFSNIFNRTVLGEFLSVAVFLLGTMVFFAWIAITLFSQADKIAYQEGEETVLANKELDTFPAALYTMFVAGVSGEFIDCFLPSFTVFHTSGFLWIIYLVLTQVLLKNLVMDTLITAYLDGSKEELEKSTRALATGVLESFNLLSDGKEDIPEENFIEFVGELQRSPLSSPIPDGIVDRMYKHYQPITKEKFCDVCEVLRSKYQITDRNSCFALESSPSASWLCEKVWEPAENPAFDQFMNKVLLINLALVILESYYNLCDNENEPAWMDYLDLAFSFVYVGEVAVKLSVMSFGEYWVDVANQFDFWTTWLLLATSLLPYLSEYEGLDLSRYANILRLLRLVRILKQLKRYESVQLMIKVVSRSIATASEILSLMGVSFFFFASLSVNLFGGLIYEGNPKLEGTEYAGKYWYAFNFNDMPMALATWFMQILLEYVPLYAEAISKVSSYGSIAWVIVLIFYITTAAIMYELLLAFTVEVFITVKEEGNDDFSDEESEEEEEEMGHGHDGAKHEEGPEKKLASQNEEAKKTDPEKAHDEEDEEECMVHHGTFLEELVEVFEGRGLSLHWDLKLEPAEVREIAEAYHKCVHRDKGHIVRGSLCQAAWEFENALQLKCGVRYPEDIEGARRKHFEVQNATKWYNKAIVGLILLTIFEVPSWCHAARGSDNGNLWDWMPGHESCPAPGGTGWKMNLSGIWYLPPGYALIVEVIIELVILRKFTLELFHETRYFKPLGARFHNRRNIYLGYFFAIGSIIDTAIFVKHRGPIRGTFFFRTGLLCLLPGVQRIWGRIADGKMLQEFTSVAVFFVGAVIFFAWILVTIFKDYEGIAFFREGEEAVKINEGLDTLRHTIYTMFLAGMTEGFVDILLPTYSKYRSSILLWVLYLLVTQVLLLNLVIDAFVAAYLKGSEKMAEGSAKTTANAILTVFKTIGHDGEVSKDTFKKFVAELGKSPSMYAIPPEAAEAIYDKLGGINKDNFCLACGLLQNNIWVTSKDSCLKDGWLHEKVTEPKENPDFDKFMSWVLLFNLIVVVAQSYFNLNMIKVPPFLGLLSDFFTFVYIGEVAVKLSVRSFADYWSSGANQFDFFTTWLLFGTGTLKYLPFSSVKGELSHYANIMRLLRLIRVIKQLKQYPSVQFMVGTVVKMIKASVDILSMLGMVLFFFSTFSVNFFGGVLAEGDHRLKDSGYEEKHWFVFNFNDHIMAFVAWFTQLLGEYEPEWADALWRCSTWGDFAWWIFPAFYLIGVAILFEILKAFTIELYIALKEEADREKNPGKAEDEEAELEAKIAELDEEAEEGRFQAEATEDLLQEGKSLHVITGHRDSKTFKRKLKEVYKKVCSE